MAEDWAADVKKYAPDANDGIIAGIVRYCGIALQKRDSSLVALSNAKETERVRENFLKKKLGVIKSDAVLDKAIAAVAERMKADRTRNRVTVYYLLAETFNKLGVFAKTAKAAPAAKGKPTAAKSPAKKTTAAKAPAPKSIARKAAAGAMSGAKAVGATAVDAASAAGAAVTDAAGAVASGAKAVGETAADAAGAAGAAVVGAAGTAGAALGAAGSGLASATSGAAQALTGGNSNKRDSGWGWLIWLLFAALVLGILWWWLMR